MADRPDTDVTLVDRGLYAGLRLATVNEIPAVAAVIDEAREALDRLASRLSEAEREKEWWTAVNANLLPYQERAVKAEVRLSEYEQALLAIAEGNLGEREWQANYERVAEFARAALSGSAGTDKPKADTRDAGGVRVVDSGLSGGSA